VASDDLPLRGLRVTELGWVWSAPMVGQHLAELGAEVVKVEWYDRFDLYRTRGVERQRGSVPERVRRESSFSFQSLNRNKLGFAADLKTDGGLDLVRQLIAKSDILIENFTVGTLQRLGLSAESLRELHPELVVLSLSATGRDSSVEAMRGYGPMLSALGGYETLVRDREGAFVGSPAFVMSDPNAALFGVFACLAGALHARQTGSGATYECSQVEAATTLAAAPTTQPARESLEGIFETLDHAFVAVTCTSAGEALAASAADLERWVAERSAEEAVSELRKRGHFAAEVRDIGATRTSPDFAGTEVRQPSRHPVSGVRELVATPWRVDGRRAPVRKAAPLLGESNDEVLARILGLDEAQIRAVHESGVVDEKPT
jgi:crotonobetainyl-CoA:carnitine CoA-transferase CaiB-like acyl-CoA transferase